MKQGASQDQFEGLRRFRDQRRENIPRGFRWAESDVTSQSVLQLTILNLRSSIVPPLAWKPRICAVKYESILDTKLSIQGSGWGWYSRIRMSSFVLFSAHNGCRLGGSA